MSRTPYAPESTYADRRRWRKYALVALKTYTANPGIEDDPETALIDLIADLFHLAAFKGFEPREIARQALAHFDAEAGR